uniref:Large ribosomal subunit protein mL42 n=2 Tax=Tetraodon nigroviridis TaxID=99883 RepID=H3DMA4_TETNG
MAAGRLFKFSRLLTRLSNVTASHPAQTCLVPLRQQSRVRGPSLEDPHCNVEIGVTSDGRTVVCHHPAVDVPYELTQPLERPDPLRNQAESHDQVLRAHLSQEVPGSNKGPSIEELSKMFFTTKHRWYPVGQ